MIEVIHPPYPYSRLYKYRYFDFDIEDSEKRHQTDLLTKKELYFTPPMDFNDPFDFTIPARFFDGTDKQKHDFLIRTLPIELQNASTSEIEKMVDHRISTLPQTKRDQDDYERDAVKKETRDFGIQCFSSLNDSILMWSHYAKGHAGFCIGLNAEKLFYYISNESLIKGIWLDGVDYRDEYPYISMHSDDWQKTDYINQMFVVKAKGWAYEQEWRLIWYEGSRRRIKLPDGIIEEIIIGVNSSEENVEKVLEMTNTKVEVYQATFLDGLYKIDPHGIRIR